MEAKLIYITTGSKIEAISIAEELLKSRLVACANILDKMNSMYWWEGKIETSEECVLIVKTSSVLVKQITEKVKAIHSYSCPCVVSLTLEDGNIDFLNWIHQETGILK
ncbi:MAG: divalent-cation tolerance protein CutA [Spirochaetota bacterium]